ncbi:MAG: hypothetical protein IPJ81_17990 [Chitinophagaceae bacterium]|nr:hypothetical protein [Chitinophagaceae bacterium]
MADNFLYIPFINPIKFFDVSQENLPKYFTKHFDEWKFRERLYFWQQREDYVQIWQTTDIINLQFESTFNPIIVKLLDKNGIAIKTLPALIGLPNKFFPNTFSFEVSMNLGEAVPSGCYRLKIEAGNPGPTQKILLSDWQYISSTPIKNSLCLEYTNSRYHEDVIFETGIQFQFRVHGNFGFLEPGRKDEQYRDQRYNPAILSSRTFRQFPVHFGDQFGLPDDIIDLLNRIWSCDNVMIDNKFFGIADGGKFEFIEVDKYPKRGVKLMVEEGINRNSSVFKVISDPNKKLMYAIMVDKKVFGDVGTQNSNDTVPIITVE